MTSAAQRLSRIRDELGASARLAGRDASSVSLIAVSKTQPTAAIVDLIAAGQRAFGESRIQEATAKWPALIQRQPDIQLHCIGRLQSNKADAAVQLFSVIHSLDRTTLLEALVREAKKVKRFPSVYLQVNIGDEAQKGGCAVGDVGEMVNAVRATPLPLLGLMAIPPLGVDPSPYFALLAKLARRHDATGLSMGMSADFPAAVKLGATAVRIGKALFEE